MKSVVAFNLANQNYSSKQDIPVDSALFLHGCSSYLNANGDAKIMIAGGMADGVESSAEVWDYDIATDTYEQRDNLPYHIRNFYMTALQDDMYIFNGFKKEVGDAEFSPSDEVHRINLNNATAKWETLEQTTQNSAQYRWFFPFNFD